MLIGEYNHSIDIKGRLNFPAKLREDLGDRFIITRGLDNCINVYSIAEWKTLEENIQTLPRSKRRNLERFFFAGAVEVIPDKQGRIVIPNTLRTYAHLEKNVTVTGVSDHVEIWDQTAWENSFNTLSPESIAQTMDELGF